MKWNPSGNSAIHVFGFLMGGGELAGRTFFHRPVDPEVMPFAVALILWQPLQARQERRNRRRGLEES